jgi:pSer/pThr/pTyr-binding forkhead associated (FHA) protein
VGERIILRDLGLTNGTTCNGVPVQEAEVHDGDEIALGDKSACGIRKTGSEAIGWRASVATAGF